MILYIYIPSWKKMKVYFVELGQEFELIVWYFATVGERTRQESFEKNSPYSGIIICILLYNYPLWRLMGSQITVHGFVGGGLKSTNFKNLMVQ